MKKSFESMCTKMHITKKSDDQLTTDEGAERKFNANSDDDSDNDADGQNIIDTLPMHAQPVRRATLADESCDGLISRPLSAKLLSRVVYNEEKARFEGVPGRS
jgi:hypothetical protein